MTQLQLSKIITCATILASGIIMCSMLVGIGLLRSRRKFYVALGLVWGLAVGFLAGFYILPIWADLMVGFAGTPQVAASLLLFALALPFISASVGAAGGIFFGNAFSEHAGRRDPSIQATYRKRAQVLFVISAGILALYLHHMSNRLRQFDSYMHQISGRLEHGRATTGMGVSDKSSTR